MRESLIMMFVKLQSGQDQTCPQLSKGKQLDKENPRHILGSCDKDKTVSSGEQQHANLTYGYLSIFYPQLIPKTPQLFLANRIETLEMTNYTITFSDLMSYVPSNFVSIGDAKRICENGNIEVLQQAGNIDIPYQNAFIQVLKGKPQIEFTKAKEIALAERVSLGIAWCKFAPDAQFLSISNETFNNTNYDPSIFPISIQQSEGMPFTLFAVLIHSGKASAEMYGEYPVSSVSFGHWITYMRVDKDTWVLYDDMKNTENVVVSFNDVVNALNPTDKSRPGLLLYNRTNPSEEMNAVSLQYKYFNCLREFQ